MTRAWQHAVQLDAGARRAWPFLPLAAPPASVWEGPGGETVRVDGGGQVTQVLAGGHPRGGAASDPCNSRRAA